MHKVLMILFIFIIGCSGIGIREGSVLDVVTENNLSRDVNNQENNESMESEDIDLALADLEIIENAYDREIKFFRIKVDNRLFEPAVIQVNKGDYIIMNFTSLDSVYDIELEEFEIGRTLLNPGETKMLEFLADKAGTFRFLCTLQCKPRTDVSLLLIVKG